MTGEPEPAPDAGMPGVSAAVARELAPDAVSAGAERPITVDQTHRSVVVDEAVIVKWLNHPVPDPHPAAVLLAHLDHLGFTEVPRWRGVHRVQGAVVALISDFVPGAVDGWEWFCAEMEEAIAGAGPVSVCESAHRLGALAARLHTALATPSPMLPEPVITAEIAVERDRCRRLLDEALACTTGEAAEVLLARSDRIVAALEALDRAGVSHAQPVHGDLHVGQFLRSADRLVLTDFDGDPLALPGAEPPRRPVAVDVASLLQSIDHAGRVAARRRPDHADSVDPLVIDAVGACHTAYLDELGTAGPVTPPDPEVLGALRAAQELHELVYAARHLPRWTYAPVAALRAMYP